MWLPACRPPLRLPLGLSLVAIVSPAACDYLQTSATSFREALSTRPSVQVCKTTVLIVTITIPLPNMFRLLIVAFAVAATPLKVRQAWSLRDSQLYTLRANWFVCHTIDLPRTLIMFNSTDEPWHRRHLVSLLTGDRLGLENFTVNPETPPLKFLPIRIHDDDDKYALRGDGIGDDLSRTPYLAALTNIATRTVSMKIVYLPTPLRESFETQTDACPKGYECTADQWIFADSGSGESRVHYDFAFGGFKGRWKPFKDAGTEGWHVYWKGNAGMQHSMQFDLVP